MREASAARFYELMVITAPDGTPEELIATVDQIIGYITTAGGTIIRSNSDSPWGRRRLAYPIRYQSTDVRDGFYTLIHLEMAPDKVIEVERDLKLNDRLMRYMILQLAGEPVFPEPVEEEPAEGAEGESSEAEGAEASEATAEARRDPAVETEAVVAEAPEVTEVPEVTEAPEVAEASESEDTGVTEEEPDVAE
ncbi:MAG: 30S ribosomal protein S6 [Thermomicrobiales bacterium]|nr:30S ribosomal protein S6 [Thermomicrobiales bacterium]